MSQHQNYIIRITTFFVLVLLSSDSTGQLVDSSTISVSKEEQLIQQQVEAYNDRDLDAFLYNYSIDIEVYSPPDSVYLKGKKNLKRSFKKLFRKSKKLHCEILERTIDGNIVTDLEYITGMKNGIPFKVYATYHIESGKIARVYFKYPNSK